MNIGIVGSEAAKFTPETQRRAEAEIQQLICHHAGVLWGENYRPKTEAITIVSGACHLGGIDIWAEHTGDFLGCKKLIFPPKAHSWETGYKPRNIQIAQHSDIVYVITLKELPASYTGMKFKGCYHCDGRYARWDSASEVRGRLQGAFEPHVKSGACWTAWYAVEKLGKEARWLII